jgi:thiol-disulfide isomerase/thioredoxin
MLFNTSRSFCAGLVAAAILAYLIVGCSQGDQLESVELAAPTETNDRTRITIEPGTWESVLELVKKNHGKVVVVDLWSTSCAPCLDELPRLADIQKSLPEDVACVSVNVDYVGIASKPPESYLDRIQEVLERCNASYANVLCVTEADVLFRELDLPSIPAVFVYGRDGSLAQRFDASLYDEDSDEEEAFTYEHDVEPLVRRLVESDS